VPKRVDHEERRAEIAAAVWRIAADRGLEAASMREIAAEAGVSPGRVQHYFADKDALMLFAARRLRERVEERVARGTAEGAAPRDRLRALLRALLPLDAGSRADALAGAAISVRARGDPGLAERYDAGRTRIAAELSARLADVRADLDHELEARTLLALAQGLASDLMLDHQTPRQATAVLDHYLGRLLP
jgi:AcrR family transcriptional regulator